MGMDAACMLSYPLSGMVPSVIRCDGDDEGARGREAAEPFAERRKLRAADDRAKGVTDQSRRG